MAGFNLQYALVALEKGMTFFRPHHQELRRRLCWVLCTIVLCSIFAYCFVEEITALCVTPLLSSSPLIEKLVYTNLPEAFIAYLKLAVLAGIIISMPMTLYQGWAFISPGLKTGEKRATLLIVFSASLLFLAGAMFAFFIILPKLLAYFMGYASTGLKPLPKFGNYLSFVARVILGFGLSFQIPFLMVMATISGIIQQDYFQKQRPYFYGIIIIFTFLLAGGDFVATGLLCLPLFLLYEAGNKGIQLFRKPSS